MDIRPIHTEADYKAALKEISAWMESDPAPGTPQGDRLDILATLVQAYEAKHLPITAPDRQGSGADDWQKQPRP